MCDKATRHVIKYKHLLQFMTEMIRTKNSTKVTSKPLTFSPITSNWLAEMISRRFRNPTRRVQSPNRTKRKKDVFFFKKTSRSYQIHPICRSINRRSIFFFTFPATLETFFDFPPKHRRWLPLAATCGAFFVRG